jgi:hypothetical protein
LMFRSSVFTLPLGAGIARMSAYLFAWVDCPRVLE